MDVLGLSFNTGLSDLGLQYAELIADFIFRQTSLGALVLIAAILLAIWASVRSGLYQPLVVLFFLVLTITFICSPYKEDAQGKRSPVMLSFLGQGVDAAVTGAIHALEANAEGEWTHYFPQPFMVQDISLRFKEALERGTYDIALRRQLDNFLQDQYMPALGMLRQDPLVLEWHDLWPGHDRVTGLYSQDGKKEWALLEKELIKGLDQDPYLKSASRNNIASLAHSDLQSVEQGLIRSMVQGQLNRAAHIKTPSLVWQISFWLPKSFLYICASANVLLYSVFPLVMLALVLTRNMKILMDYLKIFLWIKFCPLAGALSFQCSLFLAGLQAQTSQDPSWAWERPYYCLAAAVMIVVMPILMFYLFNQGGLYARSVGHAGPVMFRH